jgi:hypothetical protein
MKHYLKQAWDKTIIEPFTLLFVALFQPAKFAQAIAAIYGNERITRHIATMLGLVLPLSFTSYAFLLIARLIRIILFQNNLIYIYNPFPIESFFIPAYSVFWSIALGLIFIVIGDIHFGITYGVGTSIAFSLLSIFIRSFNPASSNTYIFSYAFPANLLTGFAIGILFAMAFAITDGSAVGIRTGIIRAIGFGIALLVILDHLENADLQGLWNGIKSYSDSSGLIGCVAVGITLSAAGDIIINSKADFSKSVDRLIIKGVTGGIIFGIIFAFVLALIPLFDASSRKASGIDNLNMISILLGFVAGFLASMKSTITRGVMITIGIIIVVAIVVSNSNNYFVNFPVLGTISSSTSPFSFMYYAIFSLALGAVGGSISSNKNWNTLSWISILLLLLLLFELTNFLAGGLANIFAATFESGIVSGVTSGIVAGMITGFMIGFLEKIDKGLTRGIIFTIAIVIAASSLGFANFDDSAYTGFQSAIVIGIGCLVGYLVVNNRLLLLSYPLNVLSMIKARHDSGLIPWRRLIFTFILEIAIIVVGVYLQAYVILTVVAVSIALLQFLFPRSSN